MLPVQNERTVHTYKGDGKTIADLPCERIIPGMIRSFWEPSEAELEKLNNGGLVELIVLTEPIPPIAMNILTYAECNRDFEIIE